MSRGKISLVLIAMVSALIISGCVSAPPPQATPTPMATQTPVPTATPAPTPTPIPNGVDIVSAPATAAAGQSFTVSWKVNSPVQMTINNTAVYYGPDSRSEPLTLTSYPSFTAPQSGEIPNSFSANITIGKTGIFYFRAHAVISGTDYWSAEKMINVTIPTVSTIVRIPTATATPYSYGGGYY